MFSDREMAVIKLMCKYDLIYSAVAQDLNLSPGTIKKIIIDIKKKSKLDPRRFWDLVRLIKMVQDQEKGVA